MQSIKCRAQFQPFKGPQAKAQQPLKRLRVVVNGRPLALSVGSLMRQPWVNALDRKQRKTFWGKSVQDRLH
jgi:hypothetical protein